MFCSKALQNKINQIQKRALRIVYNQPHFKLDKLVELDKGTTNHIKNIITLLTQLYKTTRGENCHPKKAVLQTTNNKPSKLS